MRTLLLMALTVGVSLSALAEPLVVKYIGNNLGVNENYYLDVLDMAMKATEPKFGSYRLDFSREDLSSDRKRELLVAGERVNVDRLVGFHRPKGPKGALLFVDVPLLRGMMGYRIPLIKRGSQNRFDAVENLQGLQKFSLGMGKGWEGPIYQSKGFNLYEPISFELLLKMLAGGRYDFVPLAAIEIEDSYKIDGNELKIEPERNLLIHLPMPNYFYVSPHEPLLATRLRVGLRKMEADGQLQMIFDKYFSERLKALNLSKRRIIEIPNPDDDGSVSATDLSSY